MPMMMRRCLWAVFVGLLLGCSPLQPQQAGQMRERSTGEPAAIVTFLASGGPAEQAAYAAVIEGFERTQAAIQVEMTIVPGASDFLTRLTTDFAAGAPPDLFLINYRRMTQFYNRDAIEPLGPLVQESAILHEDEFYPVALDAFRDGQGTLVCLPQNVSSQVVYYNKDLFDQAGLDYPSPDWDWQAFRQTALALTLPDGDGDGYPDQYGLGLEPALIRMVPWIWQNGGDVVDDPRHPTRLTLDQPETRAALQFIIDLVRVDGVVPSADAAAVASLPDRFLAGNIVMYIDSRVFTPTLRETVTFAWDVAPLPQGLQPANVLHSDGYCMARASQVKEAAWQFIEYAMSEEGQTIASQLGRTVPSLRQVAQSPAFLDPTHPPASAQVWLDNMESNMGVLPKIENWNTIERIAMTELEQVYLGLQSLDEAIAHIQSMATTGFIPIR